MITNNKNKDGTSAGANHTTSTNHTTGVDKQEKGNSNSNSNYSSFYRIRKYNNTLKAFSDWETFAFSQELDDKDKNEAGEIDEADEADKADKTDKADKAAEGDEIYSPRKNKDIIIDLNRGKGKLTIHKKIMKNSHRLSINNYMDTCELYRQYKIRGFKETRVHVLLSNKCRGRQPSKVRQSSSSTRMSTRSSTRSNTSSIQKEEVTEEAGHGYRYHGVHMKATSLSIASKSVQKLSKKLAKMFHLPRKEWNIGTELLVYRCGKDKMGWHADDTQGETLICTVVIESDETRVVKIRPKKNQELKNGDEEIELVVRPGDGYSMNGFMQEGYEHSLPPCKIQSEKKRKVIVFRQGRTHNVKDNGKVTNSDMPVPQKRIWFGHPSSESGIVMGETTHSRDFLNESTVHMNLIGGICGNKEEGCSSIIIANQNPKLGEFDDWDRFQYSASIKQGALSMIKSYQKAFPIRVFRSSKCKFYAPECLEKGKASYRYDGLYIISTYTTNLEYYTFRLKHK